MKDVGLKMKDVGLKMKDVGLKMKDVLQGAAGGSNPDVRVASASSSFMTLTCNFPPGMV
jgi:hypothetical protein